MVRAFDLARPELCADHAPECVELHGSTSPNAIKLMFLMGLKFVLTGRTHEERVKQREMMRQIVRPQA